MRRRYLLPRSSRDLQAEPFDANQHVSVQAHDPHSSAHLLYRARLVQMSACTDASVSVCWSDPSSKRTSSTVALGVVPAAALNTHMALCLLLLRVV